MMTLAHGSLEVAGAISLERPRFTSVHGKHTLADGREFRTNKHGALDSSTWTTTGPNCTRPAHCLKSMAAISMCQMECPVVLLRASHTTVPEQPTAHST
jgi:hypothetical protein